MHRIMLLPGIASPLHNLCRPVYAPIEIECRRRGFELHRVVYPGQSGEASGRLTYWTALSVARDAFACFQPTWMIGVSFGALVALGLTQRLADSFTELSGIALFGPPTAKKVKSSFPTGIEQQAEIQRYRQEHDTWLDPNRFFAIQPLTEDLAPRCVVPCRLIRGRLDDVYNTNEELDDIATKVRAAGGNAQLLELEGIGHKPVLEKMAEQQRLDYFTSIFPPE